MGTILFVEGIGTVMVQDRGSRVKGAHLDIYMDTHHEARRFGSRRLRVKVAHRGGEK